jgi:hypothetical protein
VGPGAGLDKCGKSRPTGIRSSDLPARSESLYRLRYPGFQDLIQNNILSNSTERLPTWETDGRSAKDQVKAEVK